MKNTKLPTGQGPELELKKGYRARSLQPIESYFGQRQGTLARLMFKSSADNTTRIASMNLIDIHIKLT